MKAIVDAAQTMDVEIKADVWTPVYAPLQELRVNPPDWMAPPKVVTMPIELVTRYNKQMQTFHRTLMEVRKIVKNC